MPIQVKRIYDEPEKSDGTRILVDRIWSRGMTKERAQLDEWMKEIAPSAELRKWFGHQPERFEEFALRYQEELAAEQAQAYLDYLREKAQQERVTLLYAAKEDRCNHAIVLKRVLEKKLRGSLLL